MKNKGSRSGSKLLADIQARFPEVTKVIDAPKTKKIYFAVLEDHCKRGKVRSPGRCPGAIAISQHTQMPAVVRRWVTVLIDIKRKVGIRYINSPLFARAIQAFDRGERPEFRPGAYSIGKPGRHQALGAHRDIPASSIPVKKRRPYRKGSNDPLRQTWSEPTPKLAPVASTESAW